MARQVSRIVQILTITSILEWIRAATKQVSISQIHSLKYDKVVVDNNFVEERNDTQLMIKQTNPADKSIEILTPENLLSRISSIKIDNEFNMMKLVEFDLIGVITDYRRLSLLRVKEDMFKVEKISEVIFEFEGVENYKAVDIDADYASNSFVVIFQNKDIKKFNEFYLEIRTLNEISEKGKGFNYKFYEDEKINLEGVVEYKFFKHSLRNLVKDKDGKFVSSGFFLFIYINDPYGINKLHLNFIQVELKEKDLQFLRISDFESKTNEMRIIYDNGENDSFGIIFSKSDDNKKLYTRNVEYQEYKWILAKTEESYFNTEKFEVKEYGVFPAETENSRRVRMTGSVLKGVFIHQITLSESAPAFISFVPSIPKVSILKSMETFKIVTYNDKTKFEKVHYYKIDGKLLREKPTQMKFFAIKRAETKNKVPYETYSNIKERGTEPLNDYFLMTKFSLFRFDGVNFDSHSNHVSLSIIDMEKVSTEEIDEKIDIKCFGESVQNSYSFNWNKKIINPLEKNLDEIWLEIQPKNIEEKKKVFYTRIDRSLALNIEKFELSDEKEGINFRKIELEDGDLKDFKYKYLEFVLNLDIGFGCNTIKIGNLGRYSFICDIYKTEFNFRDNLNLGFSSTKVAAFSIMPSFDGEIEKFDIHCIYKMEKIKPNRMKDKTQTKEEKDKEKDSGNSFDLDAEIITKSRYCHYLIKSGNKAETGNFSVYNLEDTYYYQSKGSKKFEDISDISMVKFQYNRTNDYLIEINEGIKRNDWNLDNGFIVCEKFICKNLYNPYDYGMFSVDNPSNYCPIKILGDALTKAVFTYSTRISKCEGQR